jgi:plasmid stabilization system protein ParE
MKRARFDVKSVHDLEEHCKYIASDNPDAAARVLQVILDVADFLSQHPDLGRQIQNAPDRHQEVRWFVVPKISQLFDFL